MIADGWPRCLQDRGIELDLYLWKHFATTMDADTEKTNSEDNDKRSETGLDVNANPEDSSTQADDTSDVNSEATTASSLHSEYDDYCLTVVKLITGKDLVRSWLTKGVTPRQIENLAIIHSCSHHVLYLVDPFNQAKNYLQIMTTPDQTLVEVDMLEQDQTRVAVIEQAVASGSTLLVYQYQIDIDQYFAPIVEVINTKHVHVNDEGPSLVKVNGRRLSMARSFRVIFVLRLGASVESLSGITWATIVDLRPDADGLVEDLRRHSLLRQDPAMYSYIRKSHCYLFQLLQTLEILDDKIIQGLRMDSVSNLWDETGSLTDSVQQREQYGLLLNTIMAKIQKSKNAVGRYEKLVSCALSLFSVLHSFSVFGEHYRFSLEHFMDVFLLTVGGVEDNSQDDFQYIPMTSSKINVNERSAREENTETLGAAGSNVLIGSDDNKNPDMNEVYTRDITSDTNTTIKSENFSEDLKVPDINSLEEPVSLTSQTQENVYDQLMKNFYKAFHGSFQGHERRLFVCMLWLCGNSKGAEQETELINLLLMDVLAPPSQSKQSKPDWIPRREWDHLNFLAEHHQPLEKVISAISDSPNSWKNWFDSDCPWDLPPGIASDLWEQEQTDDTASKAFPNDIIALLIIKALRPDALAASINRYAHKALPNIAPSEENNLIPSIQSNKNLPTIIFKPRNGFSTDVRLTGYDVAHKILSEAERKGVRCLHVKVHEGDEKNVDINLNTAIHTESWILIEDVEHGNKEWLTQFTARILRLFQQPDPNYRIFITYQPESNALPSYLVYKCYKLSAEYICKEKDHSRDSCDLLAYDNILQSLELTFEAVPLSTWDILKDEPLPKRSFAFAICVYHSILLSVLKYSPRTLTEIIPLTSADVNRAIEILNMSYNQDCDPLDATASIVEVIYESKARSEVDSVFIRTCYNQIMKQLHDGSPSFIRFGEWSVPVPPANVEPRDYKTWLTGKLQEQSQQVAWATLGLNGNLVKWFDNEVSESFVADIRKLFKLSTSNFRSSTAEQDPNMRKVKQVVETCLDHLPPLLELKMPLEAERSNILSYCLNQECVHYNNTIAAILADLKKLQNSLLRGKEAVPSSLHPIMDSINLGVIPPHWLTPFKMVSPSSFQMWLSALNTRRIFLRNWIQNRTIETPIDLSYLENPSALFNAVKNNLFAFANKDSGQDTLQFRLIELPPTRSEILVNSEVKKPIVFQGFGLIGSFYDLQKGKLVKISSTREKLPKLGLEVASIVQEENKQEHSVFQCPVYRDLARHHFVFSVPLHCEGDTDDFYLANTALVLSEDDHQFLH